MLELGLMLFCQWITVQEKLECNLVSSIMLWCRSAIIRSPDSFLIVAQAFLLLCVMLMF